MQIIKIVDYVRPLNYILLFYMVKAVWLVSSGFRLNFRVKTNLFFFSISSLIDGVMDNI